MQHPVNHLKKALADGERQIGIWSSLCSPNVAEIVSLTDFDWMVIDMEHAQNDLDDVIEQLRAMAGGKVSPIVRPPWNDFVAIKRLLDAGVTSMVIPYVQNAAEAEAAVAATRYPPKGIRGVAGGSRASRYSRTSDYYERADHEICLILQVETASAVEEIEAIAAVDGVDAIFIGPSDLAASMGHLGNPAHPEVFEKIREARERIDTAGVAPGILSFNPEQAQSYLDLGYRFVAVGSDQRLLMNGADALSASFGLGQS